MRGGRTLPSILEKIFELSRCYEHCGLSVSQEDPLFMSTIE